MKALLKPGASPSDASEQPFPEIGHYNLLRYADGSLINVYDGYLRFHTPRGSRINEVVQGSYALDDRARSEPALSFGTRERADQTARGLFAALGMDGDIELDACYALPHARLRALGGALDGGEGDWTPADDCYCLTYAFRLSGLPVETEPYLSLDQNFAFIGPTVHVLMTERGIEYLAAQEVFRVRSKEADARAMSAADALALFKRKYEGILLLEDLCARKVHLRYLAALVPNDPSKLDLVPAWRFYIPQVGDLIYTHASEWTTFDAITGREL